MSLAAEGVDLVDKDNGGLHVSSHFKEVLHKFFGFTLPLRNQVSARYGEEGAIDLCGARLGKKTLTSTWRAVKEDAAPWLSCALKQVFEPDRHDNGFFQTLLGTIKTCYIIPLHIGLLSYKCTR